MSNTHRIGLSLLNLKMFRRACRLAPLLGLFPFAWTFEARRSVIFFTNFIYNHYLASKDFTMELKNHFKVGSEPLFRLQIFTDNASWLFEEIMKVSIKHMVQLDSKIGPICWPIEKAIFISLRGLLQILVIIRSVYCFKK